MKSLGFCAALLLVACGSDETAMPAEQLVGAWVFDITTPVSAQCANAFVFGADEQYEYKAFCLLESGTFGIEAQEGDYSATADEVVLTARRSSCRSMRERPPRRSFSYSFPDSNSLRIEDSSRVVVYEKLEEMPASSAAAEYGCLTDEGFIAEAIGSY